MPPGAGTVPAASSPEVSSTWVLQFGPPTLFHAWSAVPTTVPAGDVDEEDAWLVGEDEGAALEPRTNM